MRSLDESGELADSILNAYRLEKTEFFIEVREYFIIQRSSSKLVNREILMVEQKF